MKCNRDKEKTYRSAVAVFEAPEFVDMATADVGELRRRWRRRENPDTDGGLNLRQAQEQLGREEEEGLEQAQGENGSGNLTALFIDGVNTQASR